MGNLNLKPFEFVIKSEKVLKDIRTETLLNLKINTIRRSSITDTDKFRNDVLRNEAHRNHKTFVSSGIDYACILLRPGGFLDFEIMSTLLFLQSLFHNNPIGEHFLKYESEAIKKIKKVLTSF